MKHLRAVLTLGLLAAPVVTWAAPYKVLVFSATAGFRHDSIASGVQAIQSIGATNNFIADATENPNAFTSTNLEQYRAVIFLNTTGDILTNAQQQAALENFIRGGGGWVGIHSAADTEYGWAWYGGLLGAYFASHPAIQQATIKVADRADPSTSILPRLWVRTDEWYNFQINPRGNVHVLATLNESTYSGGTHGADHPIAWSHYYDGGRAWYTAGGHTIESYSEPLFRAHLLGGIQFAAGVKAADPGATIDSNYQKVVLDNNVSNPFQVAIAPDGRVFYIERGGRLKVYNPTNSSITVAGQLSVDATREDGLLGLALDRGFSSNNWLYLFYSPAGVEPEQHLSRFTMNGNVLNMASEIVVLEVPVQRDASGHSAGALLMHTNGDLYISVGDNTNPFESSGYTPIDERPGRSPYDAQTSSGNANDLRGKILRIRPESNGTYSIPAGNLFPPGTPSTRPEIYVMGCRNPFRFSVDEATGWLYWGDVGPDASNDSASRGPKGHDEWNQARSAGNFGWPYFVGNNKPYIDYDFATGVSGAPFNAAAPVNNSPNNTGPVLLPPAQGAWLWYPYSTSPEFPELDGGGGRTAMGGPVYTFKTNVVNPNKLPAYYDKTLFIWEWSRNYIKEVKIDDSGNVLKINPFLPSFTFNRPMDLKIGPDGSMYLVEWGTGYSGSNPDARIVRIDYVGGNHSPVAVATATPDSGPVPLTVQFSSAGSYDPDTNDVVTLAWSFFGDGVTNSTAASPMFTYTNAGNYQAQLAITDLQGNRTVANIPIAVGNYRPIVTIYQPPNGAIFDWGKSLAYRVSAWDFEDGSTTNGIIACSNLVIEPLLGHNDHAHGLGILPDCAGVFTAPVNTDSDSDNLFLVLHGSYTDTGAPGVSALIGTATHTFQPRLKQAEFSSSQSGVVFAPTADASGGGLDVTNINHGDFIVLHPVNLTNITGLTFRVAASGPGGQIQVRADSAAGPLLGTAQIPFTGGAYTNIFAPISDPGGTRSLYFLFLRNPGDANLFVVNWFAFEGTGLSLVSTPFGGMARSLPGTVQAEDFDEGGEGVAFHDVDASNNGGQYRATSVDVETTPDNGGGFNVGWTRAGEWLNYSVNVTVPGLYAITLRAASAGGGSTVHLESRGINKTGPITIPNTGGWQNWQNITVNNVALDVGPQILRLMMDSNATNGLDVGNFNYLQATLTVSNNPPSVSLTEPVESAQYSVDTPIRITAQASDPGGSIAKVEFFAGANLIGTDMSVPYSIVWSNAAAGSYQLTARATDNLGNTTTSLARWLSVVSGQAPYFGFPQSVPGTIQAENFDGGGEAVAYHDTDVSNNGGQYRATGVDIENTTDSGGGVNVGWTAASEYLEYTIQVAADGYYTLQARAASSGDGGTFHVEIDGINKTGALTNTDSGGWQNWRFLTRTNIGLTAGTHVMRVVFDSNGANGTIGNFNYFMWTVTATNPPPALAHRYSFESAPGSTLVADSIGNDDGTVLGGAAFTGDGKLNLLGSSGYVNLPNGLISSLANVTLEGWLTWNGGANWQRIFDFGNSSAGENNSGTGLTYLALTPQSSAGTLRLASTTNSSGGQQLVAGPSALPTGQMVHVVVSYNFTAGIASLYVNGQKVASGPVSVPLGGINDINVWLGRSQWNDPYLNGQFEEFRIYNGALSDSAIAASFVGGPNALFQGLPSIAATRVGNAIQLSWPISAPGFVLENATNLAPPAAWSLITNVPSIQNDQKIVSLPITSAARFFRLRK